MDKTAKKNKKKRNERKQAEIRAEKQQLLHDYNERIKSSVYYNASAQKLLKRSQDDLYRSKNRILNEVKIEVSTIALSSLMLHMHDCYGFGKSRLQGLFNSIWHYVDIVKREPERLKLIADEFRTDLGIDIASRMRYRPTEQIKQADKEKVILRLYELSHIIPILLYSLRSRYKFGRNRILGVMYGVKQCLISTVLYGSMEMLKTRLRESANMIISDDGALKFGGAK